MRVIKSRRLGWAGIVVRTVVGRRAFKILAGKLTENRPLGIPWHRWRRSIRMDLKEMSVNTRNWINLAQDKDYWEIL